MIDRRHFLSALAAAATPLPAVAQAADNREPRNLKITGMQVLVTNPGKAALGNYVLVKVITNQPGLHGWGDCTCSGSELGVAKFLDEDMKPGLLGRNPMRLEDLWQTLFFLPYYRSGSVHMSAISGIDMALWDVKGKVAGLPVHELLGGRTRAKLLTYTSTGGRDNQQVEDGVRKLIARGYKVVKAQIAMPGADSGYAVPSTERQRESTRRAFEQGVTPTESWDPTPYVRTVAGMFDHLRKTVGNDVGFVHDVHERVTANQAVQLAKAVEPYSLFYLEDPLRPEYMDTFRLIRQQSSTPIAMGELFVGPWDGLELVTGHLIDYLRNDLVHCGGITTGRKMAANCEPYGILTAWHGPGNISPIAHMANASVSLSVSNFGIQEYSGNWPEAVLEVFSATPHFDAGYINIDDNPGLGIDVNEKAAAKYPYIRRLRPTVRRPDDSAWPY
ncbi:MAG: enolase C-terminal domain-like protein [Bryobacteraceae bacterium]